MSKETLSQSRLLTLATHILLILFLLQISGCSTVSSRGDGAPNRSIDASRLPDAVPKVEPFSKYGNPHSYTIHGKRIYVLKSYRGYNKIGFASWYGTKFHGRLTSTRETYSLYQMTAASRDLPIPCYVRVTNLENGKTAIVRVNDRGPFVGNRIIDLSYVAAKKLGYANRGTTLVRVTAIDPRTFYAEKDTVTKATTMPSRFYVQVGAFSKEQYAENYRERVAGLTHVPVYVKSGGGFYRVQVGPLAADESVTLKEKLEAEGLSPPMNVLG